MDTLLEDDSPVRPIESLHQPVSSPDGRYIALINLNLQLEIWRVPDDSNRSKSTLSQCLLFRPSLRDLLSGLTLLRWGCKSIQNATTVDQHSPLQAPKTILLSDGLRLVFIALNLENDVDQVQNAVVIADLHIGEQYGKMVFAEFVFDHQHVLAMFETNVQASIFSLSSTLTRHDLVNVKYNDSRAFAPRHDGSFGLLLRSKGQDRIAVFSSVEKAVQFNLNTNDAQGTMWSPDGDPLLVVWDSSAYGIKVDFYTAMGHALRQLQISPATLNGPSMTTGIPNVGVSCFTWTRCKQDTIVAFGDGNRHIYLRTQSSRKMETRPATILTHPNVIDGAKFIVWQESPEAERGFILGKAVYESDHLTEVSEDVATITFNSDTSFIATRLVSEPKTLWLWQPEHSDPHTAIMFRENIKQVLWHPTLDNVLLIMTQQKQLGVYAWFMETKPPLIGRPALPQGLSSWKWEMKWLAKDSSGRNPLLIHSNKSSIITLLGAQESSLTFQSTLLESTARSHGIFDGDETTREIDTPSKPPNSRNEQSKSINERTTIDRFSRW